MSHAQRVNSIQFEQVKMLTLQILSEVRRFLVEVDGGIAQELDAEIDRLTVRIKAMPYDPQSLAQERHELTSSVGAGSFTKTFITDKRIDGLFSSAFPSGHKFHVANRRRMLHELAKISQVAKLLRDQIGVVGSKNSTDGAGGENGGGDGDGKGDRKNEER